MALVPGAAVRTLDGPVVAAWSDASRGDLRPPPDGAGHGGPLGELAAELARATRSRIDRVDWVTQVHGRRVVVVDGPVHGGSRRDRPGAAVTCRNLGAYDALVSASTGAALCVLTADCAPIALSSPEGVFGAVHAGWRGLVAGVVSEAVDAMRALGATEVSATLGPCIGAGCYEFSPEDLDVVASALGPAARATTTDGRPALDLVAAVTGAVTRAGAHPVEGIDVCTACGGGQFSHRARADTGRQALLVWSTGSRSAT